MKFALLAALLPALAAAEPRIFPEPQEMKPAAGFFELKGAVIATPPADADLARRLSAELADRYGLALPTIGLAELRPGRPAIVMGSVSSPMIQARASRLNTQPPPAEGYVLDITPKQILIAGADTDGAFYGFQSLRQLLAADLRVPALRVRDWPHKPFRGIKMYLPGRDNIGFYKRFVRDWMALYKFNKLILELNAGMRLDRHPELNAGWLEFARDLNYSRRSRTTGPHDEDQDSAHHDTADFGVLEKEEVADIVRWARANHIEVIAEIPSLTHSNYLLTRHRELAENPEAEWPDTYCPMLPGSYKLLFDVLDEYIEVIKPRMVHIGHDEWRMPWGACPRCRDKNYGDLFGQDVVKIHDYLAAKGVKTAMWGDHLIEALRGKGPKPRKSPTGRAYYAPGGLTPEQVKKWIPKDILIFNWFWNDSQPGQGEVNDVALEQWGFQQVYGNMTPEIPNYGKRSVRRGVLGGAPSSWAATTEQNFGKDLMFEMLGTASMLWSSRWQDERGLAATVENIMPGIRRNMGGIEPPSAGIDPVVPLKLASGNASAAAQAIAGVELKSGPVSLGRILFDVAGPLVVGVSGSKPAQWPRESDAIPIGEDPSSIIFLHTAAQRARDTMAYRQIFNFPDTSDLLGWYEVVYEDGYIATVPVRYGVNISNWQRPEKGGWAWCYSADAVNLAKGERPAVFYAYE
jgi:hypothetical protein